MTSAFLPLLLIFGLGHSTTEAVDPARSAHLTSRFPCDGHTAPEDDIRVHVTFSTGDGAMEFLVSRYQEESCEVNVKIKCLHKEKAGWRSVWSSASTQPSANGILWLNSCYAWGSSEPAQYVLSGWYKDGPPDSKAAWQQATMSQASSQPEIYEFKDPNGRTARLEITRK